MRELRRRLERLRRDPARRRRLSARIDRVFDLPLSIAAILLLMLTMVELTGEVDPRWAPVLELVLYLLWALFVVEFLAKLLLASDRTRHLRTHWLDALVVALPVLRIFRALAVLRLGRGFSLLRLLIFGGRSSSATIQLLRRRHIGQLLVTTLLVTLVGATTAFLVESGAPHATIRTFGDALWWTAGTITTVATELYPVTPGGRVLGVTLMVYAMVVFTYLAAALASAFVGADARRSSEAMSDAARERDSAPDRSARAPDPGSTR
ncbi:MAG TPA: ion transporter [Longimicrobiales bacterium]